MQHRRDPWLQFWCEIVEAKTRLDLLIIAAALVPGTRWHCELWGSNHHPARPQRSARELHLMGAVWLLLRLLVLFFRVRLHCQQHLHKGRKGNGQVIVSFPVWWLVHGFQIADRTFREKKKQQQKNGFQGVLGGGSADYNGIWRQVAKAACLQLCNLGDTVTFAAQ